eukprot:4275341-Karenia_brevis.AAC.1
MGWLLVVSILIKWPDWGLADDLVWGLNICGPIAVSNIFPRASCAHLGTLPEVLNSADSWNNSLASQHTPRAVDERIFSMCMEEQDAGVLSEFM